MKSEVVSTAEVVSIALVSFALIVGIVFIEASALQWLLSQFGMEIGFWKAIGVLFAIDFTFCSMFVSIMASRNE